MKKAEKMNVSDRVMVLEYIGKHFSDYTEPGKGDLTYEMEYILCGKDTDKKNISEIIIAKQRNGPIGTVELVWLPNYTKFANKTKK